MYKALSLILILSLLLTSCCSMTFDSTRRVTVTAQQRDTEIFIDGYACGTAPVFIELDKSCGHRIMAMKPGYRGQQMQLKSRHTLRAASNMITPVAGAVVGTGIGLLIYGTGGYILPNFIIGTLLGGAIGLGVGVIGTAADLWTRSDCDLDKKAVHFCLSPEMDNGPHRPNRRV